jgi:hypothetical protein
MPGHDTIAALKDHIRMIRTAKRDHLKQRTAPPFPSKTGTGLSSQVPSLPPPFNGSDGICGSSKIAQIADRSHFRPAKNSTYQENARRRCVGPVIRTNSPREVTTIPSEDELLEENTTCHGCQLASFQKIITPTPVTVVDHVDNTSLPSNFRFIEECGALSSAQE